MQIFYDGKVYSWQATGGVNRYFNNVISRLPAQFKPSLLIDQDAEGSLPAHPNLKFYYCGKHSQRLRNFSYRLGSYEMKLRDRLVARALANTRFDVIHPTYYLLLAGQSMEAFKSPIVLTVWDMIHEIFPNQIDPTGEHTQLKRRAIQAAQKIICISENTKNDLLQRYAIPEERVTVTYLASDIDASMSHGSQPVPSDPYFLYVGNRSHYKNFDGMLKAFANLASSRRELRLGVVGRSFIEAEMKQIAELGLTQQIEHYGQACDRHLAKLYRCSVALVYPSLYEGFGIPPVEAMSCGTPVIASHNSSLPEVVGDAGLLFDPRSPSALSEIMLSLLDRPSARDLLIERGFARASQFSWEKTAAQTVEVYRSAASRLDAPVA
jgi:glycosyltransferase involved in cell wall biosynthesis